jgi:hypothetical protein
MINRSWIALLLVASSAAARPQRPQLTDGAKAALAKSGFFLVAADNLAIPLAPNSRGVPLLAPAPQTLELVATPAGADVLLVADGELFRLRGDALSWVAAAVGAQPAASADGAVVVGIEDKKGIKVTTGGASRIVRYRRPGRWELEHPYVSPDGRWALVTLRDYSNPNLDEFFFLAVDTKGGDPEEIALSKSFAPDVMRQTMSPDEVLLRMLAQSNDEEGAPVVKDAGLVVFDYKTRKLTPAPETLRLGVTSSQGHTLLPGPTVWGDGRQCSGDQTTLFMKDAKRGGTLRLGEGTVVSVLDFMPDEHAVIANVLELKSCKNHGVLIPLVGDTPPTKWPTVALPVRLGRVTGRVVRAPVAAKSP